MKKFFSIFGFIILGLTSSDVLAAKFICKAELWYADSGQEKVVTLKDLGAKAEGSIDEINFGARYPVAAGDEFILVADSDTRGDIDVASVATTNDPYVRFVITNPRRLVRMYCSPQNNGEI